MIVIQIGLRKAGSASIQGFMSANEELLRRRGVEYPRIGRVQRTGHLNLASELRGRRNFDPAYGALAELAEHWRGSAAETLVISSEMFEDATAAEAARLRDTLRRGDEEFRIVLVVRELIDLMASSYGQKVKYGFNTYDFDTFFEKRIGESRVDYFATAARWAGAFGWESLRARSLESPVGGDLVDDFLAAAGLDPGEAALAMERPEAVNVSPGWRVLEAVRALYDGRSDLAAGHPLAGAATHERERRRLVGRSAMAAGERLGWNAARGGYLTGQQATRCLEINTWAVAALNLHLAELLPAPRDLAARAFADRPFPPDAVRIPAAELRAFYDEVGEAVVEAEAAMRSAV
ncbi:MAG: hypothetical protein ACR2FH_01690 [Caulobacteraceae bacterium]